VVGKVKDNKKVRRGKGCVPGAISHYKASWANKNIDNLPRPK
jgi:hypothetical protein